MSISYGSADFVTAMKGKIVSSYPPGAQINADVATSAPLRASDYGDRSEENADAEAVAADDD